MRGKIGARLLKGLKPESQPFELCDSDLAGFMLRIMPTGSMTYYVRYRLPGAKRSRLKIGPTSVLSPTQARDRARDILAKVQCGEDPAAAKRAAKADTLGEFLDGPYREWCEVNTKEGAAKAQRVIAAFKPFMGKRLHEITAWDIEKWRTARMKKVRLGGKRYTDAAINRSLAYLKSALSRAVDWKLLPLHPLKSVKLKSEAASARIRYLESDEAAILMEALEAREERIRAERDSHNEWRRARGYTELPNLRNHVFADYFKPMVLLSLNTGMRRGELFGLEWRDINLRRSMLLVRAEVTKSGKPRDIPLNTETLATMKAWRKQTSSEGLVFPSPRTGKRFVNVNRQWRDLMKAAQIVDFHWHDMRHHFASQLVTGGVDLNTVRDLLGHSDLKMTIRYAHLSPAAKRSAVETLVKSATVVPYAQGRKGRHDL